MELKIELDLQAIITAATSTERLQPLVDKAIAEALKAAISDATSYSSDFRKVLNEQLKTAMPHGLRIDEVAKFQLMANQAVSEAVQGANAATIQAAIAKGLQDVVPEVPASVKLSELLEKARSGFGREEHEGFFARMVVTSYGYAHIYLDGDENCREKYRAKNSLAVSDDGNVYAMRLDGQQLQPTCMPVVVGTWEGLLLALYVGRTKLEIDLDADGVEYAAQAKED